MSKLSVGDVIYHENWNNSKYEVVLCWGVEEYTIKNLDTGEKVDWWYPSNLLDLQVEKVYPLSGVIRKVAFMNKRWDNRYA